ncbi:hypothetical protein LGR54_24610 [Ancylobacter sp. Lp-2]|uniref:hypothetical protein n=1 Tax=Ancylobacter sp. Lp-2 TaxID=2881339 RepID=UPI001E428C78|nr:hypothetical protein [Ancylobacter sp. Lp-2]MCB4771798.1 hypothetical protein [Ancylobacter sp. Lp-2]
MTAVLAMRQSGVIHIATDTLAIAPDGRRHLVPKTYTIPHAKAALVILGTSGAAIGVLEHMSKGADTFDALAGNLVNAMRAVTAPHTGVDPRQVAVLAGFGAEGPRIYMVSTIEEPGITPFQLTDVGPMFAAPITGEFVKQANLPNDTDQINPECDFPRYFEIIRGLGIKSPAGGDVRDWVGGPLSLTALHDDGRIEQRIVGERRVEVAPRLRRCVGL